MRANVSMTIDSTRPQGSSPPVLLPLLGIALALGIVAGLGYFVSVYAAAVPYALGFVALTYLRPDLAFALMLASAPFCYDLGLGPVNVALSDISMLLALPVLLMRAKDPLGRFLRNPVIPAVGMYFFVCILSILANGNIGDAITSMVQMGLYLFVAQLVFSSCLEERQILFGALYGLLASCCFLAIAKLSTNDLYVLGLHKNSIGASLSYGTIVAVGLWTSSWRSHRKILLVALILVLAGLVSTLSRGAWVGALGGVMLILLLRKQFVLGARLAAIAIPTLVVCWMLLPDQAKETATDLSNNTFGSLNARIVSIDYAYSIFAQSPILGAGVGLRKQYDATNLVMSTLAETGIAGIVTFAAIYGAFGWTVWRARRRISVTSPLLPLLAIGSALVLCQCLHGMVDHFWGRGSLPAWAGMGMAVYVYQATLRGNGPQRKVRA